MRLLSDPAVSEAQRRLRRLPNVTTESLADLGGGRLAHRELLGETRARLVAAYVWSLSHNAARTGSQQGTQ